MRHTMRLMVEIEYATPFTTVEAESLKNRLMESKIKFEITELLSVYATDSDSADRICSYDVFSVVK